MASTARMLKKWQDRTRAAVSSGDYAAGVNDMQETPGAAANRNIQGYALGVQDAVASGRVQAGNNSYDLASFKDACTKKGASNMMTGVANVSQSKTDNQVRAMEDSVKVGEEIRRMPATTREERKARMNEYFDRREKIKAKGRR